MLGFADSTQPTARGDRSHYASADDINYNRELVDDILQEHNISKNAVPEDSIIFYVNHGAYCFAFIRASEGDDPPVHFFLEPDLGIQWNYSKNIEQFCLNRVAERYGNLAIEVIASLDFD